MEYEISIERFINDFKKFETDDVLVKTFTEGYCYYFVLILKHRFPNGNICYTNPFHFIFNLDNKFYDITGDCTDKYKPEDIIEWDKLLNINPEKTKIITRDIINKNIVIGR